MQMLQRMGDGQPRPGQLRELMIKIRPARELAGREEHGMMCGGSAALNQSAPSISDFSFGLPPEAPKCCPTTWPPLNKRNIGMELTR